MDQLESAQLVFQDTTQLLLAVPHVIPSVFAQTVIRQLASVRPVTLAISLIQQQQVVRLVQQYLHAQPVMVAESVQHVIVVFILIQM